MLTFGYLTILLKLCTFPHELLEYKSEPFVFLQYTEFSILLMPSVHFVPGGSLLVIEASFNC